uniref:Uncharacterized protein n=1 Tax=Acanthochromis polyacanthus TaxID=80966 RepID=A0A3Q1FXS0_9TELE
MQVAAMGLYVIKKEGGESGQYDDIGIFVDGMIILDNIESAAQACVVMLGVIYALNLPKGAETLLRIHSKSAHGSGWG